MADNATTPAPGTHPDAVVINDNGSVTTRKGKGFVWVHDESTGARYDVPASMLPRPGLTPVVGYPVNYRPTGRTPKTALLLGDLPVSSGRASSAAAEPVSAELAAARATAASLTSSTEPPAPVEAEVTDDDQAAGAGDESTTTTTKRGRATR